MSISLLQVSIAQVEIEMETHTFQKFFLSKKRLKNRVVAFCAQKLQNRKF